MEFERFLFVTRRIDRNELFQVLKEQLARGYKSLPVDSSGFFSEALDATTPLDKFRLIPFGDVLKDMSAILASVQARAGMNFDKLIWEWKDWHRQMMEPVSQFSTQSKFGRAIYCEQLEKKLVAKYVVDSSHMFGNGEKIILPEGSSAFYVGMAIAAYRDDVSVVTTNGAFIREYRDNPKIAQTIKLVTAIGGEVDYDHRKGLSDHGGVFGLDCQHRYIQAIRDAPGATIVVMPVTGILPDDGPYAADGPSHGEKLSILKESFAANVRLVIFVADYSKHLGTKRQDYGVPIFSKAAWKEKVQAHSDQVVLVTCPPPKLRESLQGRTDWIEPRDRTYDDFPGLTSADFTDDEAEYNQAAKQFDNILRDSQGRPMFHEALATNIPSSIVYV
jgi:hypothetical protein